MNVLPRKFTVSKLVQAFKSGNLLRNPEYQRGEAWTEIQKATFIDSLLRAYPVPALFLHVVESAGLEGAPSKKFEIVDGQQRLTALRDYSDGKFRLLDIGENSKLRIPKSIRAKSAPWAGKFFADLPTDLQKRVEAVEITVFPEQQKQIRKRDGGKCKICGDEVAEDQAEYDHYPIPHRDGGRTVVENGRLLHKECHPRGRPPEED